MLSILQRVTGILKSFQAKYLTHGKCTINICYTNERVSDYVWGQKILSFRESICYE